MKRPNLLPSVRELNRLFELRSDGTLLRRQRSDVPPRINKRFAGKPAGYRNKRGYIQVGINDTLFLAHRIIWKMSKGVEPPPILDHVDTDPSNNRLRNLRSASLSSNMANRCKKAGRNLPKGVYETPRGRYHAQITIERKTVHLGAFATPDEAHAAYARAARRVHGAFARWE